MLACLLLVRSVNYGLLMMLTRADLIEYAYGNESTTWGKARIADGHPDPYKFRYIELGNEQVRSAPLAKSLLKTILSLYRRSI